MHQITVVGIAVANGSAINNECGVQIECIISDYFSKEKLVEIPITMFHPPGSRFTNQTISIKRGSSIFFSGALTFIDDQLYVELHNFSFINNQTFTRNISSSSPMPWSFKKQTPSSKSNNSLITEQEESDHFTLSIPKTKTTSKTPTIPKTPTTPKTPTIPKTPTTPKTPTIPKTVSTRNSKNPPTSPISKRKTRSSTSRTSKVQKLADIASNIIAVADSDDDEAELLD